MTTLMQGKRGLIMGVANEFSIGWGIAIELHQHGAQLAFSYPNDSFLKRLQPMIEQAGMKDALFVPCDVSTDEAISDCFQEIQKKWGEIDFVVHAIAFSDKEELKGQYLNTSKQNFATTMDVSCYSFTSVCREAAKITRSGGSFLTLSYFGAEKVILNYNVMGVAKAALEASVLYLATDLGSQLIRVNAISAGPIKTLSARAIGDFSQILSWIKENAPLRRNVTQQDVGRAAVYLLSELGSGTTGEILHVDCGYNTIGMRMNQEA